MDILKINTKDALYYRLKEKSFPRESALLLDSFFNIELARTYPSGKVQYVYKPHLSNGKNPDFALIEILPHHSDFLVRIRRGKKIFGQSLPVHQLSHYLSFYSAFYNTFSLEATLLDYPMHHAVDSAFSIIDFFHEAPQANPVLEKIAVIADPSENLEGAYQEGKRLFHFFKELLPATSVSFFSATLSPEEMDQIFHEYTIVHFSGHIDERGLLCGPNSIYHPGFSQKKLAPFIFLNGCSLSQHLLKSFIQRGAVNLIYSINKKEDLLLDYKKLQYFYLGLLAGYRIGDVARKTLDFKSLRLYGWMTNRLAFP